MDWENVSVKNGATTSATTFNDLFGILSRPTDLFSLSESARKNLLQDSPVPFDTEIN